jgi:hypothetical protein
MTKWRVVLERTEQIELEVEAPDEEGALTDFLSEGDEVTSKTVFSRVIDCTPWDDQVPTRVLVGSAPDFAAQADSQGFTPLARRLLDEGITHEIEHTGGGCMALTVPCPAGTMAITCWSDDDSPWTLSWYRNDDWSTGAHEVDHEWFDQTADEVVALLRAHL